MADQHQLSVLLVEDHPFQQIAMQMHLNRLGLYCLTPALDMNEAREACAARKKPFDLLICDINLPDGNGAQLVTELAAAGRIDKAIIFSCLNQPELDELERSLKERGTPLLACLPKPLDQRRLREILERDVA